MVIVKPAQQPNTQTEKCLAKVVRENPFEERVVNYLLPIHRVNLSILQQPMDPTREISSLHMDNSKDSFGLHSVRNVANQRGSKVRDIIIFIRPTFLITFRQARCH